MTASHAAMTAPIQAMTEISLGILLVLGLLTRPAAGVAFLLLGSLWVSEWGTVSGEYPVANVSRLGARVDGALCKYMGASEPDSPARVDSWR